MNEKINLNIILNKYHEQKLAHAYLIETNNIVKTLEELKIIIKKIVCSDVFEKNCYLQCNKCNLIDNDSYPALKIIKRDGLFIKKDQIEDLIYYFSKDTLYGINNFYIILECQFLNIASSNSILKFLEEPDSKVVGFYITDYKERVLPTIISRCQVIKNYYNNSNIMETLGITEDDYIIKYALVEDLIKVIVTKIDPIMYDKTKLLNNCVEHKDIVNIFKILLDIYEDAYKKIINTNYSSKYEILSSNITNSTELLLKSIELIKTKILNLDYNVNMELLLEDFLIKMEVL